jgi:hypothetical protein
VDSDRFFQNYGANAAQARAAVNAALSTWENTIQDFNFRNVGQPGWAPIVNLYSIGITADHLTTCGDRNGRFLGCGGATTLDGDGKPFRGSVTLDDDGAGLGWNFNVNNGAYTNVLNRFAADGGPAGEDIYSVALHEIGHTLGISIGGSLAINNRLSNPGLPAPFDHYRVFTFLDATRAGYTDDGHTWDTTPPTGFPSHPNDLMNPSIGTNTRRLVSDLDATILRDAYGYTTTLPSTRVTFLANYNTATQVLTVTGDPGTQSHNITLDVSGATQVVTVDGVVSRWALSSLNSIVVGSGSGNATINVLASGVPVNINSTGSATVSIGANGSLGGIQAAVNVVGSPNTTSLTVDDSADTFADRQVTLSDTSLTISPSTVINYSPSAIRSLTLEGGVGSTGTNTFHVFNTPAGQTTIRTRGSHDFVQIHADQGPVAVGGFANNSILVSNGGWLNGIQAPVTVANIGGLTAATLTVDDSADTFANRLVTLTGTALTVEQPGIVTINYSAITSLTYEGGPGSSGANTYQVLNTPTAQTTLRTRGGNDFVQIHADQGPVAVGGFANNAILVGNAGSLGGIQAPVSVANIGGLTSATLTVDDSADTFADRVVTLAPTALTVAQPGLVTINYSAITSLTYNGGPGSSGSNVFNVLGTAAGTSTTLNGGSGNNNTLVGANAPTRFNITGSNAGTLTGGVSASFSSFQNLTGGSGNDAFVFADGAGVGGNIRNNNGAASTLDYSAYSTPVTVNLAAGTATGVGGSVQNILTLRGGGGDDSLTDNATGTTIFVASPGNDTVTGLGTSNNFLYNADANGTADSTWSVTGQNSGTLTFAGGTTTFAGVQNLNGAGTGAVVFVFADGAGVDGNIAGGGGTNTLDYSAYASSNVLVNLQTSFATGVGGSIANIQNVKGANGGAAGRYNILVGNGGNVLTGGNGRRNLLIAGNNGIRGSTLIGGDQDDILIGGTTTYDREAGMVSLQAIMAYWAGSADDYNTRVANLRSGTGVPLLDASKVTGNRLGNTLTGGPGIDLFYGDLALDAYDWDPATETFISV